MENYHISTPKQKERPTFYKTIRKIQKEARNGIDSVTYIQKCYLALDLPPWSQIESAVFEAVKSLFGLPIQIFTASDCQLSKDTEKSVLLVDKFFNSKNVIQGIPKHFEIVFYSLLRVAIENLKIKSEFHKTLLIELDEALDTFCRFFTRFLEYAFDIDHSFHEFDNSVFNFILKEVGITKRIGGKENVPSLYRESCE